MARRRRSNASLTPAQQRMGAGCLMLFSLPFIGVGIFATWMVASSLLDYQRMQRWESCPAVITELEKVHGDDTVGIRAKYTYRYRGAEYQGDRVAIYSGSDNIGKYQQQLYARLQRAQKAGETTCFVDPVDPNQAVLARDLRWGLLAFFGVFALVFGGAGTAIFVGAIIGQRTLRRHQQTRNAHPNEPWRMRDDWVRGIIRPQRLPTVMMVFFTVIWNAIAWPIAILSANDDEKLPSWVWLLVVLFPLIGTLLALGTVTNCIRLARFGGAKLRLATIPGVIGGKLVGVVELPCRLEPADGFRVMLRALRTVDDGESSHDTTVWDDERVIERSLGGGGAVATAIPVELLIPSDVPATNPDDRVRWELGVGAALWGPDLDLVFDVPVYRTADSRDGVRVTDQPISEYEQRATLASLLQRQGLRMEQLAGSSEVVFVEPPAIHVTTGLVLTALAGVIGYVANMLWSEGSPWIAVLVGLVAFAFGWGAVHTWLMNRRLSIRGDRWRLRTGWWPGWYAEHEFTTADIAGFNTKQSASSGNQRWNQLQLKLKSRKQPLVIAGGLTNRSTERAWIAELERLALGG